MAGPASVPLRLLHQARRLLADDRPADALPMLDRLRTIPACRTAATPLRAAALHALDRSPEAEAAADEALAETPGDGEVLALRARIRLACGKLPGAIDDAAAAVMARPNELGFKLLLGAALLQGRRFDEAIWFLGEALRAQPEDPVIQARLGEAFMLAGRHEAAAELLAHCAALAPGLPHIAALRAQNMLLAGDAAGAEAMARAALQGGRVGAPLHSILAHALIAQYRLAEAGLHAAAAARLAPDDPYLVQLAAALAGDAAAPAMPEAGPLRAGPAPGYRVPGLIRRAIERCLPAVAAGEARLGPVLDLGCGAGLVGTAIADLLGAGLVGVDPAQGLLDQAAAGAAYGALRRADPLAALQDDAATYAVIVAADLATSLGHPPAAFALARARLAPAGLLVGCLAPPSGQAAAAPDAIAGALRAAGLEPVELREEALHAAQDGPVAGLVVVARAALH